MKNKEVVALSHTFMQVGSVSGKKLAYVVSKNIARVKSALTPGNEILKETPEYLEYEKKRTDLCMEYCEKGEDGQPRIENQNYVIATEKMTEFNGKVEELKKEHEAVLDVMDEKRKKYQEFLEEESTFEPYKIKMEDVPENITPNQLQWIMGIIDEE